MGPDRDRTRDPWICSQTRICSQTLSDCATRPGIGYAVADFLRQDFYVDDGLKSLPSDSEAIGMIHKTKETRGKGGLHLHKFISNPRLLLSIDYRPCGFKQEDFFMFSYLAYVNHVTPGGGGGGGGDIFGPNA